MAQQAAQMVRATREFEALGYDVETDQEVTVVVSPQTPFEVLHRLPDNTINKIRLAGEVRVLMPMDPREVQVGRVAVRVVQPQTEGVTILDITEPWEAERQAALRACDDAWAY